MSASVFVPPNVGYGSADGSVMPPEVARAAVLAECRPGELLAWHVHPDRVVVIHPSGRKLAYSFGELEPQEVAGGQWPVPVIVPGIMVSEEKEVETAAAPGWPAIDTTAVMPAAAGLPADPDTKKSQGQRVAQPGGGAKRPRPR